MGCSCQAAASFFSPSTFSEKRRTERAADVDPAEAAEGGEAAVTLPGAAAVGRSHVVIAPSSV